MLYFVAYDISSDRRRRRVARVLEGYGSRLHESAFQCELRAGQLARLRRQVERVLDPDEDRLHLYPLCERDRPDRWHLAASKPQDPPSAYVV
ncbi:CRISPR-associated endonuclease Cas2 [Rubrivivax benzoatilyticus]|uniref:CRISPR-associated endoribonuclease Cas2 n=1 Tax=Rubrivivax benzoatilyticus TaxID=316997 RepID=A0ABX0HYK9_9BURK|nr:CRISPR-associated endonuclease Cas2 [Rubrivivax benzoatilyticus]EGJ09040.1 hypothetical protein RBXJA2T_01865 [Rubrivivax benzoatilyticus JA2 = ATCC BAA-35]NHK99505.1 CRISPR-associated endonuclease Cas2 [Rubrivivax benzoatilyticus]NHL25379.1 CRISPR-associated endonuclease Cas2 [Rubrivivax benzoatilyticus]